MWSAKSRSKAKLEVFCLRLWPSLVTKSTIDNTRNSIPARLQTSCGLITSATEFDCGSESGFRCPIFKVVPQATIIDSANCLFPLDIANSPLRCSPVRKRPRLESSPSFSELSPLEEQHLSVLDDIEKRFTQCQQGHSPSSRKGVSAATATPIVSHVAILFNANIILNVSLAFWNAYLHVFWICSNCSVTSGSLICSALVQGSPPTAKI
jgi:hypothetical protein